MKCRNSKLIDCLRVQQLKLLTVARLLGCVIVIEKAYETLNVTTARNYANLLKKLRQKRPVKTLTHASQEACNNFLSRAMPNSRNIFADAEANIKTHNLPSFVDSPVSLPARRLYSLPTREVGLNIAQPIDYETEIRRIAERMRSSRKGNGANAPLTQECITHDQLRDGLCIRYNIEAKNTPSNFPCGEKCTLSQARHCIDTWDTTRHHC